MPFDVAIKPFLTGKPHSIGSGLGLHVANEMMKSMNGKIILITDENEIDFPNIVKENGATKAILALCFPKKKSNQMPQSTLRKFITSALIIDDDENEILSLKEYLEEKDIYQNITTDF
ncbi:MAG: hypothetical protein R2728_07040 [Chitinophagales bacterium]